MYGMGRKGSISQGAQILTVTLWIFIISCQHKLRLSVNKARPTKERHTFRIPFRTNISQSSVPNEGRLHSAEIFIKISSSS